MNYLTDALKEAMKEVFVDKALKNEFDAFDFNQLDMDDIEEKAVKKLQKQKNMGKAHAVEMLGEYISGEEDAFKAYNALKKAQREGEGAANADDFVTMAEIYEYDFRVDWLLAEVELSKLTLDCPRCNNHLTKLIEDSEEIRECEACGAEWEESTGIITLNPDEL